MSKKVDYILSGNSLSLFSEGKTVVLSGDAVKSAVTLINAKKLDELYKKHFEVVVPVNISDYEVKDGMVFVNGRAVSGLLNTRMLEYIKAGLPVGPLVKFFKRIQANPSYLAVQRLFECLDHNKHPLVEDGRFLAWKRVDSNFKDLYTGKIDNSVGSKPTVSRNEVDDNMDNTCSHGLHVASFNYANSQYGGGQGHLTEVLVDPADVVAIPRDYNSQKMRVTSYEVISVCKEQRKDQLVTTSGKTADLSKYDNSGKIDLFDEEDDDELYTTGYRFGEPDDADWDDEDEEFLDDESEDEDDEEDEDDDEDDDFCGDPGCWCARS